MAHLTPVVRNVGPLRHVVTVVAVLVVGCLLVAAYARYESRHTPQAFGSWSNDLSENGAGSNVNEVPHFFVGTFQAYDQPPTIGYLVRIDDKSSLKRPIPWLRVDHGNVFVHGTLVPRRHGIFQLFVDNGQMSPLRLDVPIGHALQYFNPDATPFTNYRFADSFWQNVLHANERLAVPDRRPLALATFEESATNL